VSVPVQCALNVFVATLSGDRSGSHFGRVAVL
jgi:hypothetical protein